MIWSTTLPVKESYYIRLLSINHFEEVKGYIDYSESFVTLIKKFLTDTCLRQGYLETMED
jgi:hypothetical protein